MKSWMLPALAGCLPLIVLILAFYLSGKRRRARSKAPLTEKLLRPPGESLREQIAELDDKLNDNFLAFALTCGWVVLATYFSMEKIPANELPIIAGFFLLFGYAGCGFYGLRLRRILNSKQNCRLGFLGERAVGEELNQMMAEGYHVFHDLQCEDRTGASKFNIDHIAVGPGGVFSIETKTRRKRIGMESNSPNHIVKFDGAHLQYPWGYEDHGVAQARQNGLYLEGWLQKATGDKFSVTPILALPGWFVERRGRSDVTVVSGRGICAVFPKQETKAVLTPEQIKRIAYQLEQRCRDVEVE